MVTTPQDEEPGFETDAYRELAPVMVTYER